MCKSSKNRVTDMRQSFNIKGEKICFVMPFHIMEDRGGGAEVQAWLLARNLARRGANVSYIAQSVRNREGQKEIINGINVSWVKYAHHFRWSNGVSYYRTLSELDPDMVVQRTTSFVTGVIGLYCKRHQRKFVWICTDNESPSRWVFCRKQIHMIRKKSGVSLKAVPLLINAFIYDVSRHWGMKQVTHPFTQNNHQRTALRKAYRLDSHHMISGHAAPRTILKPRDKLVGGIVLWTANLSANKRPEKFVELARLGRNTDLRFVLIGSRADRLYLEDLFRNKPENLDWLGRRPFRETLAWFDRAAFLVNTSREEGFPNTYIQAWLRGVPVISLGVDPNNSIERHKLGYVVCDVEQLLQKIIYLVSHEKEYIQMSKHVMRYASFHHSDQKMTDSFLDVVLE